MSRSPVSRSRHRSASDTRRRTRARRSSNAAPIFRFATAASWREIALALGLSAPIVFGMMLLSERMAWTSPDEGPSSRRPAEAAAWTPAVPGSGEVVALELAEDGLTADGSGPDGADSADGAQAVALGSVDVVLPITPTIGISPTPIDTETPTITMTPSETPTPSQTPTPSLTPTPTETPTPGPETNLPIIPPIDGEMKARLRGILADGLSRGNRPDVFAKVGDSITASRYFLVDVGCGGARFEDTPEHAALAGIVERFRTVAVGTQGATGPCGAPNSFTRRGFAAASGWTAARALSPLRGEITGCPPPFDTPLRCELETIKPSIALIMFGTNDLQQRVAAGRFRERLQQIATDSIAAGVIPVFGTIPPRGDAAWSAGLVGVYNGAIVEAARSSGVPVWNSWRAMSEPPAEARSLAPDGIHPSVFGGRPADFRGEAILSGYNGRNLGALQVLARITRVVIDDGAPEQ